LDIFLDNTSVFNINSEVIIPGSKSESNRLLILKEFFHFQIENLSNSDDTCLLEKALKSDDTIINIGHAGTAMRFLTAYFSSIKGKEVILTGSKRMQQRPIKILVDSLRSIGGNIEYVNKEGFPPLKIKGQLLKKDSLSINANVSSQYISALLLIAPSLKNGLKIKLKGKLTSIPYIQMTLSLLNQIGIKTAWNKNIIQVFPKKEIENKTIIVESDWSAASYYYSFLALSKKGKIKLSYFKENSLQGDKELVQIYKQFGVKTSFKKDSILLEKISDFKQKKHIEFDLQNTPDIAQTIAVTCLGLGVSCELKGLHTLKIKETDRLEALKIELQKFDAKIRITNKSLHMKIEEQKPKTKEQKAKIINTYNDHRMAMAFAPLSLKYYFTIKDSDVVSKSYPDFWKHFNQLIK